MDKKECLYAYQYYYLHISTLLLLLITKNLSCKPFTVLFKLRMTVVLVYKDRTRTDAEEDTHKRRVKSITKSR